MSGIQAERTTQVEEKKQRDSNFELMRIVAMLLIVLHHLCQQGLWFSAENSHSLNSNVASSFSVWTGLLGNWLFILISGYFGAVTSFSWKKVFKLWFQIFFTSATIGLVLYFLKTPVIGFSNDGYPARSFFEAAQPMTRKDLIRSLLPTLKSNNWFASTYLVFYVFLPFLSLSLKSLPEKMHRNLIVTMMVMGTVLPYLWFQQMYVASKLFYFILGFYIASYIRIYNPGFLGSGRKNLIAGIFLCLCFGAWNFVMVSYGERIPFVKNHFAFVYLYPYGGFEKIPVLICAVFIFGFFKNLKISFSRFINIVAGTTFGVYLIHENLLLNKIIWHRICGLDKWTSSSMLIPYMLVLVPAVFACCSAIEFARQIIIERPLMRLLDRK